MEASLHSLDADAINAVGSGHPPVLQRICNVIGRFNSVKAG